MWLRIRRRLGDLRRSVASRFSSGVPAVEPARWLWTGARHAPSDAIVRVELSPAATWNAEQARRWQASQSYRPLWLTRLAPDGGPSEVLDPEGRTARGEDLPETRWRVWLEELPEGAATAIESCLLVLASEAIDRVDLELGGESGGSRGARRVVAFRAGKFAFDPASGELRASAPGALVKTVSLASGGVPVFLPHAPAGARRGAYSSDQPLPQPLEVGVEDASSLTRVGPPSVSPRILVLAPFLARGGAEHTLFETTRVLAERGEFEFVFATLAPHRRELGDRRGDFRAVSPLLYSLGDLLHPGAMYGALLSLIDSLDVKLVYNANGTTLFYDFARRLRRDRPNLPLVDHLYDHRVGYIEWYTEDLPSVVDWCVAENHPIAEALASERAFPRERAPVLWPCGRAPGAFPAAADRAATRRRIRAELGVADDRLLVLTAARAHPQKRPLDWVTLADRLRARPFELLWVGGGDLERELDRALAAAAAPHARRLPFRDDIPELLTAADVACLVSDFEGLPVFLLEALQAGCPFVGTDVGDIGRVLLPSRAGLVSGPPGDVEAIARALETLLDRDLRASTARAAEAAAADFGVAACADRYGALFRKALVAR